MPKLTLLSRQRLAIIPASEVIAVGQFILGAQ